jgi:VCBS repeat-containing protein
MKDFVQKKKVITQERIKQLLEQHYKKATSTTTLMLFATGLAGCGGGDDDSGATISIGTVFDGPLSAARVFIDANENGLLDASEDWALTNSDGSYSLSTTQTGSLGVVSTSETIDKSSGVAVTGLSLFAPANSNVISPATTVVKAMVDNYIALNPSATAEDLETATTAAYDDTLEALGLSPDLDLTSFNPFSTDVDGSSADAVAYAQKAAQIVAVANTVAEAESAAGGGDKAGILSAALTEIATQIQASAASDTTVTINTAFVNKIIEEAAPTMEADATLKADISGAITKVSESLEQITDVAASSDLFYASQAVLVESAVERSTTGTSDILSALSTSTDVATLASSLVKVTGTTRGTIGEDVTSDETTGDISVTGSLTVDDTYKFSTVVTPVTRTGETNVGSLSITEDGVWTYTIGSENAALLNSLQSIENKGTINYSFTKNDAGYKSDEYFQPAEIFRVGVLDADGNPVEIEAGVPLTKLISVSVEGANDTVILNVSATTISDVAYTQGDAITSITVTDQFSDPDYAEKLTYSATSLPSGVAIDAETGEITGTIGSTNYGEYNVAVTATDTGGEAATTESFKITVANKNDSPELVSSEAVSKEAIEDAIFSFDSAGLFIDPDISYSHDENDYLTYTMTNDPNWLTIDGTTGVITGTPENADVATTTISITATDAYNEAVSQEITLEVTNTNDTPLASTNDLGNLRDTLPKSFSGSDFANSVTDDDVGDDYTLTGFTQVSGTQGTIVDGGDGSFTFTPVNGEANEVVTFSYTVTDTGGLSATASATLNVLDAIPVGTGSEDGGAVTLETSDYPGASFAIGSSESAEVQAMYDAHTGVFTPAADFNGSIVFDIIPSGEVEALPGILIISAVNDDPVISQQSSSTLSVIEDTDASGTILASDVDDNTLTFNYSAPIKGTVTDPEEDGTYTYSPNADANGADSFIVTVSDGTESVTQEVSVTIAAVADVPKGDTTATLNVTEDTIKSGSVVASDGDGDTLTYTFSTATKGAITQGTNGAFDYVPTANEFGSDSFTITVSDGDPSTADLIQTVAVSIASVNDVPTVIGNGIPDANSTSSFTLSNLSDYFEDLDGESLSYSVQTGAGTATVTSENLSISGLTPGTTTVTVTATDGEAASVSDAFDLTVLGDLITSTVSTSGNSHTIDFTLNMNGVQSSTMTSIDGFDFSITATGSPDSSSGIDRSGLNYATFNDDSANRTTISNDWGVSNYTTATNFRSDIFNTSSSWSLGGGDAVALATDETSYNIGLSGDVYDIATYLEDSFKIGTLSFNTQSDLTDLDLVISGSISGSFGTNPTTSVAEEILTAVTIDII